MKSRIVQMDIGAKERVTSLGFATEGRKDILFFIGKPNCNILSLHGDAALSDFVYEDKIPADFQIARVPSKTVSPGVFFSDDGVRIFRVFGAGMVQDTFVQQLGKVLGKNGIMIDFSPHRAHSNDLVFEKDGKVKKFCGMIPNPRYFTCAITFTFHAEKVKDIYRYDTEKMKARGNITDLSEIVGGLTEVNPEVTDEILMEVARRMARILRSDVVGYELNEEELSILNQPI